MKLLNRKLLVLVVLSGFFVGCNSEAPILTIEHEFPNQMWTWNQPVNFEFNSPDTSDNYHLYLAISNEKDYPYQNIYTKVVTHFPNGDTTSQILSLDLYDKRGNHNGECSGDLCTSEFVMQESFTFLQEGQHNISLYQQMRNDSLRYIHGMELRLFREKVIN